ncbi:MAG: toll/interleukin-1 receptor domain-containing protein [Bacteroidia bacterium]
MLKKTYDVFISYAIEDKSFLASGIASGLKQKGLNVYFAGDELSAGDLVSDTIYEGLEESEYCIVVLSKYYIRSWPIIERSHILRREKKEKRILIFPVWHNITIHDVKNSFPELLDHYAESSQTALPDLIDNLYNAIIKKRKENRNKKKRRVITLSALALCLGSFLVYEGKSVLITYPDRETVEKIVAEKINGVEKNIENAFEQKIREEYGRKISFDSLLLRYTHFWEKSKNHRNEYIFVNHEKNISGHSNIQALKIPAFETPDSHYGIVWPDSYLLKPMDLSEKNALVYIVKEPSTIDFEVDTFFRKQNKIHALVTYKRPIRIVYGTLKYDAKERLQKQQIRIYGFKPKEEYILTHQNNVWEVERVE